MNKVLFEKQRDEKEEQEKTVLEEGTVEDNAEEEEEFDLEFYMGDENEYYDENDDAIYG